MSAAIHICALFLAIVNIISAVDYAKVPDATRDPNTKLILWGARSANANPRKFFEKKDTRKWGKEEEGELNKFGKEQSYFLGQALRKFVGNDADQSKNFLNLNYLPSESAFYTSNLGKCQETLQVALASLYLRVDPPDNWIQKEFSLCNWNPVQYSINQTLLKIHDVGCPKSDEAWDVFLKKGTPEFEKLYAKHRDLLDYMDKKTGWNNSLESASEFAENLIQMQDYYKIAEGDWPDWLTKNLPSGYNDREALVNGYAIFSEVTQRACAKDKACQRIMSGYWLNHILETIDNAKNGKDTRKLLGYVSTTEETLSLMKAMFVKGDFLTKAGGFLVEVRDSPEWAVRVLKHHPIKFSSGKKAHKIYKEDYTDEMAKVADKNGWVKLDDFNRLVKPNAFNDWRSECGLSSERECEDESTAVTGASVVATLPPATCSMFCPRPPKKDSKPDLSDIIKDLLTEKINTIKKLLNGLLSLFKSSGKNPGLLEGLLGGLGKLLDDLLNGLLSGLKGDLDPLKKLSAALDKLLADLPKVETPTIPDDDARAPRALLEPTRRRRQAIQLLGLEGLIANVLKLVKQLVNDLLPALQKLLKDIGPDLLQLLDKLLGSLRELLDKVLTGLILALDGNSSFLSALSGGLKLLGALG